MSQISLLYKIMLFDTKKKKKKRIKLIEVYTHGQPRNMHLRLKNQTQKMLLLNLIKHKL